jgi:NhaA family Na+:H+ antiporter
LGIQQKFVYIVLGVFLWYCILKSGVHGTLAGVLLAATIPNNSSDNSDKSMLKDIEQPLHHFVGIFILPLFAFFNSDFNFQSLSFDSFMSPISMGIMLGLILGKPIGITLFAYLSVKLKICDLPDGIKMIDILGLSFLCGIGFTMSLFINNLAFNSIDLIDSSKLGIFVGSIVAAIIGYKILKKRFAS